SESQNLEIRRHLEDCKDCRREEQILKSICSALSPPETFEQEKDVWPTIQAYIKESDPVLSLLAETLARRRVMVANDLVIRNIYRIADIEPIRKNAAALLNYFAQWTHM